MRVLRVACMRITRYGKRFQDISCTTEFKQRRENMRNKSYTLTILSAIHRHVM
jgi:hypothetical protein